jgi:levanase/fructan beta-fructosidase
MIPINKNVSIKHTLIILFFCAIYGCKDASKTTNDKTLKMSNLEETLYRPNFHFTPKANWMNDPNGMFYLNGIYHLYFQYYPNDNVWGPMHWGHATSKDLVIWEEQPIAIYPDSLGYIFSGSAVVDINNTSGFGSEGKPPVVAIFTYHDIEGEKAGAIDFQSQALAYSLDEGQTWTKYDKNPVLPNPGIKDFRDPKVVWDNAHKQWLMALATYEKSFFYSSPNLKDWTLLSEFGEHFGAHGGVWECPDIFPLKVEGTNETKWVLLQSLNPGHLNGGSGTQYFIGDFDGKEFVLDASFKMDLQNKEAIWLDYGRDNYAGVTWSNIPESDGRKLFMAWMSNWDYAKEVPTTTWRSAMTLARELTLKKVGQSYLLFSKPVKELNKFKKTKLEKRNLSINDEFTIIDKSIDVNRSVTTISITNLSNNTYTFTLGNEEGNVVTFGINNTDKYYFIDRTKSGDLSFSDKFANVISKAFFDNQLEKINLQIIIDKTSIELFYNEGETVMTEIFFTNAPLKTLKLSALKQANLKIEKLKVEELEFKN